jgi:ABC-type multidrug transport system ATPase subunit
MRLDDVWLRYGGGPWVLCGVTARLDAGTAATVTGPNGAGKSTLLCLVAGLLRADRGTVRDRPARIGYVPERFPADQPVTARQYLTAMSAVYRRRAAEVRVELADWGERLHFTPLLDRPLAELSKGSAQKVGLMQALLGRPELLILDEPWEGLDAQTRIQIPLVIAEIVAAGGRVLVSDHLGQTVALPGMRRWELSEGRLREAEDEPPAECVVEVAVAASDVSTAVASLRAAGHRILRVRGEGPQE